MSNNGVKQLQGDLMQLFYNKWKISLHVCSLCLGVWACRWQQKFETGRLWFGDCGWWTPLHCLWNPNICSTWNHCRNRVRAAATELKLFRQITEEGTTPLSPLYHNQDSWPIYLISHVLMDLKMVATDYLSSFTLSWFIIFLSVLIFVGMALRWTSGQLE